MAEGSVTRDRAEWNRRIAAMKRRQKIARIRQWSLLGAGLAILVIAIVLIIQAGRNGRIKDSDEHPDKIVNEATGEGGIVIQQSVSEFDDKTEPAKPEFDNKSSIGNTYTYNEAENVAYLTGDNMTSLNAILVDVDNGLITGGVDYRARIYPASMTKVMTLLVAVENTDDFEKKVPVSSVATNYAYSKKLSAVNFAIDENVTIKDLCYGTILPSGADAAAELAIQVAGSMDDFVVMMNERAESLGISDTTHFSNVSGSFDENNYSTCEDLAKIMNAAMDNEYCRQVLSAHKYTTSKTTEHPDGIEISNWFLRRIEDKDTGGEVIGAKTGFVVESRNCAVSYYTSDSGRNYIAVTVNAHSAWRCIYDHVDIYKNHTE